MSFSVDKPPASVCLLRLSAIGDITHVLPMLRTLQAAWPNTRFTWVIGKLEAQLLAGMDNVEFIIFDKSRGWDAMKDLRKTMKGRHFDVLLNMQMALRAGIASLFIPAKLKLGFDKARAKDYQWLFTNAKIAAKDGEHVLDSFFGFCEYFGIHERRYEWNIPITQADRQTANALLPNNAYFVINPCTSANTNQYRAWNVDGYTQVANYISQHYGLDVVLTGAPSDLDRAYGEAICQNVNTSVHNLIGQTSLKEMLVVLEQAQAVLAPDTGPAHMASAMNTPVVGLYANTNPQRARAYQSADSLVNFYPQALEQELAKQADEVKFGTRVRVPGIMDIIPADAVITVIDQLFKKLGLEKK